MPKPVRKPARLGRNDPCHCGSGRKYKDCHLLLEAEVRTAQLRLRQAQDLLLPRIVEAAQAAPEELGPALERFWQGRYQVEQLPELDQLEDRGAERFLVWYAFDVCQPDGQTLVSRLADEPGFAQDEYEQQLLAQWRHVRLRPYIVEEVLKGSSLGVRDMLEGGSFSLADAHASRRLAPGEVLVGHLVPADTAPDAAAPTYYLAGAAAQLTDDTAVSLLEFAELHLADLRRSAPEAGWADLIETRSEILNHYVSALPTEQPDPTIFARIVNEGRLALQLTTASVAALLGRPEHVETPAAEDGPAEKE